MRHPLPGRFLPFQLPLAASRLPGADADAGHTKNASTPVTRKLDHGCPAYECLAP